MTPIENILQGDVGKWDYLEVMRKVRDLRKTRQTLVDFHKARLGRQSRTFNGEYRYWVWETERWTVYVSNFKGVGFEVPESFSVSEALAAWEEYKGKVL